MNQTFHHKYNLALTRKLSDIDLELYCFVTRRGLDQGGLGPEAHFKNAVNIMWGPKSTKHFIWHPWAEEMLHWSCKENYLGVIGCGSSGKTDFFAIWGIINWLASRYQTKVLVTSTSLKESKKRIWGSVTEYYSAVKGLPGKLIDSLGQIRSGTAEERGSDKSGLELISGEKKKEREAVGKLIGMKNKRMILIADELPELSEALLSAAYSNLALNPYFQMIGIGNFNSIYDPLGVFVTPQKGYNSVSVEDNGWETEKGYCLRFDGLKSPNILTGRDDWPIYNNKDLRNHKKTLGENTALFWRMCRSFPCPEGEEGVIYSEADMLKGRVHETPIWLGPKTPIGAFDPGFTSGGDRSVFTHGFYGRTTDGLMTISFTSYEVLQEDISLLGQPRNFQIAKQLKELCVKLGISPMHMAYDATAGGGILFGEILSEIWSGGCLGVNFGGYASEARVSAHDEDLRDGRDVYANRVSELWSVGLEFVRHGQIKGLPVEMAKEWKTRRYTTEKRGGMAKTRVETKTDMKARTGKSPDVGDAGVMLIALCRQRLGAVAGGSGQANVVTSNKEWERSSQSFDEVYQDTFSQSVTSL